MNKKIEDMTEEEMLDELKTWDDDAWNRFKENNYECISLQFDVHATSLEERLLDKVKIGKYWFKRHDA